MPSYLHIPTGLSTGLPERLFKLKTREYVRVAFSCHHSDPHCPVSAQFRQDPGIVQWLIAQLPCAHPTPVRAWVKGLDQEPGRSQA